MAYYAALVSIVQLLKEITHPQHQYPKFLLEKQQIITSLYEKFNLLQELLEDYSPKDMNKEAAGFLETRIRDASYQAQDIIESQISAPFSIHIPTFSSTHIRLEKKTHGVKRFFGHLFSAFRKAPRQLQPGRFDNNVEKVKEQVDSILKELMKINVESHTNHQDNVQLNSYSSADSTGGASKVHTPSGRSTMVGFEKHLTTIKGQLFGESSKLEVVPILGMRGIESSGGASKIQAPSSRNTMVGFDKHLTTIKDQLCGQSYKRKVISIVGMGGIGKTTLARNMFDDKLIDYHFDCRAWVTVSQEYHLRNILLAIVSSLNINQELHGVGEEVLKEYIYKHLKGMRYLIIMDDMWDTKVWDDIKRILPDDSNGSRVILTTRLSDVAVYTGSLEFLHQMQFLNEDQSWILFREKVFCPPELEDMGRLIAKNCRGLPLAIVVVAGLLSKANMTRYDWEKIARGVSSTAAENDEHFSKILSLSYNHLPHHLKPCFLYLGGFPKDYEISTSKLIKLWVAEGFLNPSEYKSLEEVAEEYLEDLVNRNLVLITKQRSNGKYKKCSIHDVLGDLSAERARSEKFLHVVHKYEDFHQEAIENVRRICVPPSSLFRKFKVGKYVSCVRSILFFLGTWDLFLSDASGFKLLRVLDASNVYLNLFPSEILELLHLRYLALWHHDFSIPSWISKLQNLQTLVFVSSSKFETLILLPYEIWKMPQLRHVIIPKMRLHPIPDDERIIDGVPLLGKMQTLGTVVDFIFTRDTVEMITSIKKLKVHFWRYEQDKTYWEKFGLANLVHLRQLETLDINVGSRSQELPSLIPRSQELPSLIPLPDCFVFPQNLKKLSLYGCRLPWKDMTAVGLLPNLQVLKLWYHSFVGEEWETREGEFPRLKFLQMDTLHDLKYWRAENTHFPCLEHLRISYCLKLEEIPSEIGDIPTLQLIEVHYNNKVADSSALKIQEEQRDLGNDVLQVRVSDPSVKKYIRLAEGSEDE